MKPNSNFEKLIRNAMCKCNGIYPDEMLRDFQLLYPFTTENITGYINNFDLYNKTLLTVGSSGDQVINGSYFGSKNITCLDICPYTKFYIYLKISCLLELTRNEFLTFLSKNKSSFDINTYKKIKDTLKLLDNESYLFWNKLFFNFKGLVIRRKMFYDDENSIDVIVKSNPYLHSDIEYDEAREKIMKTKIEIINDNVLKTKLDKRFDSIWLSNIGTYFSRRSLKIMVDNIEKNLNENGKLLISYLYNTSGKDFEYQADFCPIYNLERTLEILQEYNPELISFTGIDKLKDDNKYTKDSILICQRKK